MRRERVARVCQTPDQGQCRRLEALQPDTGRQWVGPTTCRSSARIPGTEPVFLNPKAPFYMMFGSYGHPACAESASLAWLRRLTRVSVDGSRPCKH